MDAERTLVRRLTSSSPAATEALARELGAALPPRSVVALSGELGAGKTCFVRGLARGLGIDERVTSPTFTLMHVYGDDEGGGARLHHFDAWMEGRERAYLADGGAEWLGEDGIAAVEWAERVADWLPLPQLWIELAHRGPEERVVTISVAGAGAAAELLAERVRGLALLPGLAEMPLAPAEERT